MEKLKFNKHYIGKCYINFYNRQYGFLVHLIDDLKRWLNYKDGCGGIETSEVKMYLICKGGYFFWSGFEPNTDEGYINCSDNADMFLAIAALRDDTDKYQWFFSTGWTDFEGNPLPDKWVLCDQDTLEKFAFVNNSPNSYKTGWKKANVQELINHFKIE